MCTTRSLGLNHLSSLQCPKQRAGRAGRTGPGKYYQLFTNFAYNYEMSPTSIPEILRINLGVTTLLERISLERLFLGALDEEGHITKLGLKMTSFRWNLLYRRCSLQAYKPTKITKAITVGFVIHAARKDPQEGYRTIDDNQPVYMHPASALFQRRQSDWVIYHELVMTTKEYIRKVTYCHRPQLASRS
ncbi:putative pre-mRNA-splicing factor ATP-dependent RNA helicase-like protein [Tanacetum coccineum]